MVPPPPATWSPVVTWCAVRNLPEAITLAKIVVESVVIPDVRNLGQAVLKILAGGEMGFGAFASLTDIHIVNGKPVLGAKLMAAAIRRSPLYDYQILRLDAGGCELEFFRAGRSLGTVLHTEEDARRAGLLTKDNWKKHPDDMHFARAISKGFRRHCPDLCGGLVPYAEDEIEEVKGALATPQESPSPAPAAAPDNGVSGSASNVDVLGDAPEAGDRDTAEHIKEVMVVRFAELIRALAYSADRIQQRLRQSYGVDTFRQLTVAQAQEVLDRLERALDARSAEAASPQGTKGTTPS
jgi:hypothetical protein